MVVKSKQQSKTPSKTALMTTAKLPSEPVAQAKSLPEIKFDDAVELGRTFVALIKWNEMELGALASRIEPKYGEKTLAKFAEEIDFPLDRLNRCRSVYRAYKGTPIEGTTPKFALAQALQAHPDRVNLIQASPGMTTAEARGLARAERAKKGKKPPSKSRNDEGATRAALALAIKVHSEIGHVKPEHLDAGILRGVITDPEQADTQLRTAGQDFFNLAKMIKEKLAPSQSAPEATQHQRRNGDGRATGPALP